MIARRPWAWPLVPLYAGAVAAKDILRALGVLRSRQLAWPVVSVGSLAAGGAGKTPVVIALAGLLRQRGWHVDVLSRGYGRQGSGVERVDAGAEDAALRFGDEPVLLARRTGAEVWVGADRFRAGREAEAGTVPASALPDRTQSADNRRRVHLLDDGFQHRRLRRTMDVIVVTAEDLDDALLPAGNRRERLHALRRADAVVVREEELAAVSGRITGLTRPRTPIWTIRRALESPPVVTDAPTLAFCGIARPEGFFSALRTNGIPLAGTVAFPDHWRYTSKEAQELAASCRGLAARAFITTEKDAVKLTAPLRSVLEAAAPLYVARIDAAFLQPEEVVRAVESAMEARLA